MTAQNDAKFVAPKIGQLFRNDETGEVSRVVLHMFTEPEDSPFDLEPVSTDGQLFGFEERVEFDEEFTLIAGTLTEHGILSAHPEDTRADLDGLHDEAKYENDDVVIYGEDGDFEYEYWSGTLDIEYGELYTRMHEMARNVYRRYGVRSRAGDPWAVLNPVVYDARTFENEH